MSLKKLALIALIVVTLLGSVIAFGCKPKAQEQNTDSTAVIDTTTTPTDTTTAPAATTPTPAPTQAPTKTGGK